jgi:hypothetical protein
MTGKRFFQLAPFAFLVLSAGCSGKSGVEGDADEAEDTAGDEADAPVDASDDEAADEADGLDAPGDDLEQDPADAPAEDEPEEEPAGPCGNGILEPELGEICDDGNVETEFCGRRDDCLGDCSLRMGTCGNGLFEPEAGEQCDDGNRGIGAPCTCLEFCEDEAFWNRTVSGCEAISPEGTGGVVTCIETTQMPIAETIYAAEGYCTLLALGCEGNDSICEFLTPVPGDVDAFDCPEDSIMISIVYAFMGATITIKICGKQCAADADCRWNAWDRAEDPEACGQNDCRQLPADPSSAVCIDVRNADLYGLIDED